MNRPEKTIPEPPTFGPLRAVPLDGSDEMTRIRLNPDPEPLSASVVSGGSDREVSPVVGAFLILIIAALLCWGVPFVSAAIRAEAVKAATAP